MSDFVMPSLGADMEDGTLVEWQVKAGDAVKRGDIVAVVDTQKGAIDVEIFEDGVVEEIVVPVGAKVPVGAVLARVRGAGDKAGAPIAPSAPVPKQAPPAPPRNVPAAAARAAGRHVSPAARKRAAELGVDLSKITAGPGAAITIADVEAAKGAAGGERADAAAEMRHAIGAAMARSKREIPHYYLAQTVDLGPVTAWLAKENAARPVTERLIAGVVFIRAVALALRDLPEFNGFWEMGRFHPGPGIHPGIAVSLRGGGLVAPALHDADRKDLGTLMREFQDLVQRARGRRLRSSELADGTITITSLGERGVETVYPIIYPPQVAVIGFGSVVERPWSVGGRVETRPLVTVTLGADHRVSDGHRGGLFLRAIEDYLRDPSKL
jgi:pyruvate dehydrogenase E2 component (dihydrolipoamide acetyltransferase)